MDCPRCRLALTTSAIEGVAVDVCPAYEGVLVKQQSMIPLLQKLSAPLAQEVDIDAAIEPLPARTDGTSCPECRGVMASNGYMGTRIAFVTACTRCNLAWLDSDVLQTITILFARTDKRVELVERAARERGDNDLLVQTLLRGRSMQRVLSRLSSLV